MNVSILVPIKEHSRAKSRLSALLTPHERGMLAWAMFEDLIRALAPLRYPVALVTASTRAAARVSPLGWRVIREDQQVSESLSIDAASAQLAAEGTEAVLRLPADLPLIQSCDVAEIFSMPISAPFAVLAPSGDGRGTNAILRSPPCLFPSHFGPDSFSLHLREAELRGIPLRILENSRLGMDIDEISDIVRFLAQPADGETHRTLIKLDIQERLAQHAIKSDPHPGTARYP